VCCQLSGQSTAAAAVQDAARRHAQSGCAAGAGTELRRFVYDHPLFDLAAIDAQYRLPSLQGKRRTWFAGAWTGYGFHEDGLKSALRVAADFDASPTWAKRMNPLASKPTLIRLPGF